MVVQDVSCGQATCGPTQTVAAQGSLSCITSCVSVLASQLISSPTTESESHM